MAGKKKAATPVDLGAGAGKVPWGRLLDEALTQPGKIADAYSMFHNYSVGNMFLAMIQLGDKLGPIATFRKWKELGRSVKKGEKAIALYMPVTVMGGNGGAKPEAGEDGGDRVKLAGVDEGGQPRTFFILRRKWFSMAQTEGDTEPTFAKAPGWDAEQALATLGIQRVAFASTSGNRLGYTERRTGNVAVSVLSPHPTKTLCHELAHSLLHANTGELADHGEGLPPADVREVEAESVAYLVCATLGVETASLADSRGYIQGWMDDPERRADFAKHRASRVFSAAQKIIAAGRPKAAAKADDEQQAEQEAA